MSAPVTPNCLACQHCTFDSGWGGSEVTPPEPMLLRCKRGRWDTDKMATMSDIRRDILEAAEGCPDFAAEPWAAKYVKPEKGGES